MLDLLNNEYITMVLVPILIGVLEVIKKAGLLNTKFIPVVSLFLGIMLGIVFTGFDIRDGFIAGMFIGLSAVGLYSSATNVVEGFKSNEL